MPRGAKPGERRGGRGKGARNRKTLEAGLIAERARNDALVMQHAQAGDAASAVSAAQRAGKRLGKEILSDFANVLASMAAYYQPRLGQESKPGHEQQFKYYAELAIYASDKVAAFESPKLGAVLVGAAVVDKVEVTGGMPDDFVPPVKAEDGKVVAIASGTIITADEPEPAPAAHGVAAA